LTLSHVQDIMIIKHFIFVNLLQNIIIFLGTYIYIYFVIKFQNHGSEHDRGLYWIKNALMYGMHTNEKIKRFVNMHISCDVSITKPIMKCTTTSTHMYI
jgi:hypothetical protein